MLNGLSVMGGLDVLGGLLTAHLDPPHATRITWLGGETDHKFA